MAKNAVQLAGEAIHKVTVGTLKRCPKCEKGQMFESYYHIRKRCPECNVKFQPYEGDALGVYAVSYFLALIPGLLAALLAFFHFGLSATGCIAVFGLVSGLVLFTFFPNFKGLWIALVFLMTGLKPSRV